MSNPVFKFISGAAPLHSWSVDVASLLLRASFGALMLFNHGVPKWNRLISQEIGNFPDPLGVGSYNSLLLTVFAEVVGALLLVTGLFTRFAAALMAFTMLVAAFYVHWEDPFKEKEHALLFFLASLCTYLMGAGKYSLDYYFRKKQA
jgi:putative oxidoreductase